MEPIKVPLELEAVPGTVGELIYHTVISSVKSFRDRQRKEPSVLSQEEWMDRAAFGKIVFSLPEENMKDEGDISAKAVKTAIQAFLDGLVAVFVDGIQKKDLQEVITITPKSVVVFVRLTMLAGRMW